MRLSVVLAVQEGAHRLDAVLTALAADLPSGVEVLVVWPGDDDAVARQVERLTPPERTWLRPLPAPAGALVPALWTHGIERATAPRVALTIVHCVPVAGWLQRLVDIDLSRWAGVGGPIDQRPGSDALGWAIYLQRYAPFASSCSPDALGEVPEIAGDNALYDRAALDAVSGSWDDGFWEPAVHAALRAGGARLAMDPGLRVLHHNGYSARGFCSQRLRHGYRFGRDRALGFRTVTAIAYAAASPAVPLLFGRKVLVRALGLRGARAQLPGALPWLAVFIAAWSLGEISGAHAALWSRAGVR